MPASSEYSEAYAGRWVIRLNGRIIAHGGTPSQALQLARLIYPREKLQPEYMPLNQPLLFHPLLPQIIAPLPADLPVYLVGGMVRDALLKRRSLDIDLVVPSQSERHARSIAQALQGAFVPLDSENGVYRVVVNRPEAPPLQIDITSFKGRSLEDDLLARDFTINAIAFDLRSQTLHDPLGGQADLRAKVLRQCGPQAFRDDPLRILRMIRLAGELGFRIQAETRENARQHIALLENVAAERVRDELVRILNGAKIHTSLHALDLLGALPYTLQARKNISAAETREQFAVVRYLEMALQALAPEYDPEKASDLFNGLLVLRLGRYRQQFTQHRQRQVVNGRTAGFIPFLAALLPNPATLKVQARALALSNAEISLLEKTARGAARFLHLAQRDEVSRGDVYRFFKVTGEAGPDAILLGLAQIRGRWGVTLPQETWAQSLEAARTLLENYWEKPEESVAPPRLLDGHTLMEAFHLPPGPIIGQILADLEAAQAEGRVLTRSDAVVFVEHWLDKHGENDD